MILHTIFTLINIGTVLELLYGIFTRFSTNIQSAADNSEIVLRQNFKLEDDPMCGLTTGNLGCQSHISYVVIVVMSVIFAHL